MRKVILYTRRGCCLCTVVKDVLESARTRARFELEEVDIDRDPALRQKYNDRIPVVAIDGVDAFQYRLELEEFLKKLGERP